MTSTSNEAKLATAKTVLSTAASVVATVMLARSVAHEIFPHEFQDYFFLNTRKFFKRFSSQLTVVIDEYDGFVYNKIYEASEIYLGTKISPSTQRINVSKPEKENKFTVKMESNEEIIDVFQGVKFKWILVSRQKESRNYNHGREFSFKSEVRAFEVSFPKKHKEMVLETYLPYIVKLAKSLKQEKKTLKIFTVDHGNMYRNLSDAWRSMNLDHPATFDTLAMDNEVKDNILKDLDRFLKRKDYYKKVGKAWKRGYLLYGPPGTGKSSLIAAMANHSNFDIYDLELTELRANSDLRRLLVATANRSILVVEDIDCTIELEDRSSEAIGMQHQSYPKREKQVTLSGLLNFIDGLWSSCGDERIIIFTTNHKEQLDLALLRPGRMDVHIHMSYCTSDGFKVLANNYLGIKDHALFGSIEELIKTTQVTPAEVAEQLMRSDGVDNALSELIEFLRIKNKENEEANAKKIENDKDEVVAEIVMEEKFNNFRENNQQCI